MFDLEAKIAGLFDVQCFDADVPMWAQKRLCEGDESIAGALKRFARMSDLVMRRKIKRNNTVGYFAISESEFIRLIDFIGVCGYLNSAEITRWKADLKRVCDERRARMIAEIRAEYEDAVRSTIPDEFFNPQS